jgi:hypothetical protein
MLLSPSQLRLYPVELLDKPVGSRYSVCHWIGFRGGIARRAGLGGQLSSLGCVSISHHPHNLLRIVQLRWVGSPLRDLFTINDIRCGSLKLVPVVAIFVTRAISLDFMLLL